MNPNNPQTKRRLENNKKLGGINKRFQTPDDMQKAIDEYFKQTETNQTTVTGLAISLGFAQRKSLLDYEGYSPEFCNIIKKAILRVENSYELDLRGKDKKPVGSIFALKNMGWSDRQEIEHSGSPDLLAAVSKNRDAKAYYKRKLELLEQANKAGTAISEE